MFSLRGVKYKDILQIEALDIPGGQVTSIFGESGSGKTTLLRLLNKLASCDRGEIRYNDVPIEEMDSVELRRKVVMLPQSPALFPGSIRDNLLLGLKFAEKPLVSDDRLREALGFIRLNKDLHEDAGKLSGGEKQRVALARVMLLQPEAFLLDEPSSALDEDTEHLIIRALAGHAREHQRTMVMVTHSKRIASEFSDEVVEISGGRIVGQRKVVRNG